MTPVTQIKQGDTCKDCPWLVRGAEEPKGTFNWGCRFYHQNISFSKPYPTRPSYCNIDGRIDQEKYNKSREKT